MIRILIVDDERSARKDMYFMLRSMVDKVIEAESGQQALSILRKQDFDLIISDLRLPKEEQGLDLAKKAKEIYPLTPILMISAYGSVDSAVKAMKMGVDDYISKDFSKEDISLKIDKLLETRKLLLANVRLNQEIKSYRNDDASRREPDRIIGESAQIKHVLNIINRVASDDDSTVLVTGESGTGKELVARAIHQNNPGRKDKEFVVIDISHIPATLLESQLFGHEKGAFTNAYQQHKGLLEVADGGTVFLDEIGDFPLELQVKLLRFLQEKTFTRIGGNKQISTDVRVITATNKDLKSLVEQGRFREDFYYRLSVVNIVVPPLRNRKEDIPLLLDYFCRRFEKRKKRQLNFSEKIIQKISGHDWQGNIRQLRNFIESLYVLCPSDEVSEEDLNFDSYTSEFGDADLFQSLIELPLKEARNQLIQEFEYSYLKHHLQICNGNISRLAEQVGESREGLSKKIKRFKLKDN